MLRTIVPKNARSKRALEHRAPKKVENPKRLLLLRGSTCSLLVQSVLTSLNALKKPNTLKFSKKNENIHPFDDFTSLAFFAEKNDTSLIAFGSHSKKRPHNLVLARCFDGGKLLDMVEFGVVEETWRPVEGFPGRKPAMGSKYMLLFAGGVWEKNEEWRRMKSLWLDFFRGEEVTSVDVEGLQSLVSVVGVEEEGGKRKVMIRCHMLETKKSGVKGVPRVEVQECGPRLDLVVRREERGPEELWKEAMRRPRGVKPKTKKNVEMDIVGDKMGRIHTGKQDLTKLQSRKMKGLKRAAADDDEGSEDEDMTLVDEDEVSEVEEEAPKKRKKARKD